MPFYIDVAEVAEFSGILALVCITPDIRYTTYWGLTIGRDVVGDVMKQLGRGQTFDNLQHPTRQILGIYKGRKISIGVQLNLI